MKKYKLITVMLFALTLVPLQSNAMIGLASGIFGIFPGFLGFTIITQSDRNCRGNVFCSAAAAPQMLMGAILLNKDGSRSVELTALQLNKSTMLGVSKDDIKLFNSQLTEANIIFEDMVNILENTESPSTEQARALLGEYGDVISKSSLKVMNAILF